MCSSCRCGRCRGGCRGPLGRGGSSCSRSRDRCGCWGRGCLCLRTERGAEGMVLLLCAARQRRTLLERLRSGGGECSSEVLNGHLSALPLGAQPLPSTVPPWRRSPPSSAKTSSPALWPRGTVHGRPLAATCIGSASRHWPQLPLSAGILLQPLAATAFPSSRSALAGSRSLRPSAPANSPTALTSTSVYFCSRRPSTPVLTDGIPLLRVHLWRPNPHIRPPSRFLRDASMRPSHNPLPTLSS